MKIFEFSFVVLAISRSLLETFRDSLKECFALIEPVDVSELAHIAIV